MSSEEPKTREEFLAEPLYQQWIVHCAICGRYGRTKDSPVHKLHPEHKLHPKFQELFPVLSMSAGQVCQVCLPRYKFKKEMESVCAILHDYVQRHGHPCDWLEFEYWVSKEQGPGWYDYYQNTLAEESLNLACFEHDSLVNSYDNYITCRICGRKWRFVSEEWRMMVYRSRLIPDHLRLKSLPNLIGNYFSAIGFEPDNKRVLDFEGWKNYMLSGETS
jgi:hypothetical protein